MPLFGDVGKKMANAQTAAEALTAVGLTNPATAFTQTYSTAAATNPNVTTNTITDSTGGTPSTTALVAISAGYVQSEVRNNMATLAAELALTKADLLAVKKLCNSLVDLLQAAGLAT